MQVTGIDIGGSHITVGLVEIDNFFLDDSRVLRNRVDCHAAAEVILSDWCLAIRSLWALAGVEKMPLAFAMPGPFDYEKGICLIKGFGKYEALYGIDIRAELSKRLAVEPTAILFRNDAEAFLAGELRNGAAKGYDHAIGITLGTGMGTAKSHYGKVEDAEMSFKVKIDGATIEEFISTRGVVRSYFELSGKIMKDAKVIATLYDTDPFAVASFRIFANHLSYLLNIFIKEEQPEVLVVGGNIASAWALFMPHVIKALSADFKNLPDIKKAGIGEHSAIVGAAILYT